MGVDRQLPLPDLFVDLFHEVDYRVHQLTFIYLLCVEAGDQETDVIPSTGFLGRIKKFSARFTMKHMNLWHKILISSACFTAKLTYTELMEPSILFLLIPADGHRLKQELFATPDLHLGLVVPFHNLGRGVLQAEGRLQCACTALR